MRTRLGGIALVLAGACGGGGGGAAAAADAGGATPDAARESDAGTGAGVGLVVHWSHLTEGQDTWVVLSDGSREKLEYTTDASFPDAALPQDVHIVQVGPGVLHIRTYAGIDIHEIWLDGAGHPYREPLERRVEGTVSSPEAGTIWLRASGGDLWGSTSSAGGGYAIDLTGTALGPVDVVAYQRGPDNTALRVGAVRGVDVTADDPVTGVDVVLDHAVDQTVTVSVSGDEPYGGAYKAQLVFQLGRFAVFFTEDEDLPIEVLTPAMDAPMQALERFVWVPLGLGDGYDFGPLETARIYHKLAHDETAVAVAALQPFQQHEPAFATADQPTVVAQASFDEIRWTADPAADEVELSVQATGSPDAYQEFSWSISSPAALGRVALPVLPPEVVEGPLLRAGDYVLYTTQHDWAGVEALTDLYAVPGGKVPTDGYRNTRRQSFFSVE